MSSAPSGLVPREGLVTLTHAIYALHAFSAVTGIASSALVVTAFLSGWPSIIAVILNYVKRSEVRGTWLDSHFSWQIRTFWYALLWLVIGGVLFVLMTTWRRGRRIVHDQLHGGALPIDMLIQDLDRRGLTRVPGTAVFMTSDLSGAPPVLLHHLKHNKVLHERVILMSITTELVPQIDREERLQVKELGSGFHTVEARYGFMESPDVPTLMGRLAEFGIAPKLTETSFYLGRETLIPVRRRGPCLITNLKWRRKTGSWSWTRLRP